MKWRLIPIIKSTYYYYYHFGSTWSNNKMILKILNTIFQNPLQLDNHINLNKGKNRKKKLQWCLMRNERKKQEKGMGLHTFWGKRKNTITTT